MLILIKINRQLKSDEHYKNGLNPICKLCEQKTESIESGWPILIPILCKGRHDKIRHLY